MNTTTERVPLNSAVIEERNASRCHRSESERERRRRLAINKQHSLAELLLRNATGHFALEEDGQPTAALMRNFLGNELRSRK